MKLKNSSITTTIFQLIVIVLMSISASYAFLNTQTNFLINKICFYRYFAYGMNVVFSYVCVAHYNKRIAFLLSFALSALALSPLSKDVVEAFPTFVSFFAVLMGITTVLLVPAARGRGFFEFLLLLVLPTVLAESRIGGFPYLIATSHSITYYQILIVNVTIVGGYFYLRYATLGNLLYRDFLLKGEGEGEANTVNKWTGFISGIIIVVAVGTAALLAIIAPVVTGVTRLIFKDLTFYAFALMGCIGIVAVGAILTFQILAKTK
ncbi:MAG: hypothetical protein OEX10_02355 [Candidatus Bathyarchaeota archaeon]|nr:hypothetical protein [Candidatus Bathyarchaeota archaeon]